MNYLLKFVIDAPRLVLIDTWWNVNILARTQSTFIGIVLIDTWWNVNRRVINGTFGELWVLIDTWWNVNL